MSDSLLYIEPIDHGLYRYRLGSDAYIDGGGNICDQSSQSWIRPGNFRLINAVHYMMEHGVREYIGA